MNDKLLDVMKQNEMNRTLEATFFETQRSISLIVKQTKFAYDEALSAGFDKEQALIVATNMFKQ